MEPTPGEKPSLSDCKRNFYHAKKNEQFGVPVHCQVI